MLFKNIMFINIYIYIYIYIVTVHTMGRNEEHGDEDKLKYTVFNVDKAGQTQTGTPGVTSRPDEN